MALGPAPRGGRRVVIVATILAAAGVTGAGCGGGGTISRPGSAAASHTAPPQIRAAILAMEHAANFSFTATIVRSGGTSGVSGEFVAPDIEQLSVSAPNGSHNETLFVGSKAFVRSTSGQWVDAIGNPSRPTDPRATFSSLLNANFAAKRNGTFDCVLSPGAAAALLRAQGEPVRCSITVSGPTVTTVRLASSSVRVAIVYSSVGTSPPITHP